MEKIIHVDPYNLEYYDIYCYAIGHKETRIKNTEKKKHLINFFVLMIFISVLIQSILIAEKLDGSLTSTNWFLIFLPLLLDIFFFVVFCGVLKIDCDYFIYLFFIAGYFLSVILPVAAKLENRVSTRFVKF